MHVHILGICGTFMGSLALLAKEMGHKVSGSDANVYPPMSTQLAEQGISLFEGFGSAQFDEKPDVVIVGNAMSRGNEAVEFVLDNGISFTSGPQWLSENLLKDKWVLAVSGTHGKTSTTGMLAWILEYAGMSPGFLIGGVPSQFEVSARLGSSDFFVIEADEYDTAFFDKRSKFVHYCPKTLVINNLEYDHADIFQDLDAIKTQFNHLLRILPRKGLVIYPNEKEVADLIARGCWSQRSRLGMDFLSGSGSFSENDWTLVKAKESGAKFKITSPQKEEVEVSWSLIGDHNLQNAFSAIVAAQHVGVPLAISAKALSEYKNIKRRMECIGDYQVNNDVGSFEVRVYDDFAHHPTAISATLSGLRESVGAETRIIAIIEPRSNTMKMGVHGDKLQRATAQADAVYWLVDDSIRMHVESDLKTGKGSFIYPSAENLYGDLIKSIETSTESENGTNLEIVFMSNGGFENLPTKVNAHLNELFAPN